MVARTSLTIASVVAGIFLASNLMLSAMLAPAFAATNLNGAGATFPSPLIEKWADEYAVVRPSVVVSYSPTGSGAGTTSILGELIEFGASEAPLTAAERATNPDQILEFPLTIGGVVVTTNIPDMGPTELRLTGKVVADIYLGKITFWDAAGIKGLQTPTTAAKLPHEKIKTVHRSDSSGTTFVFTEYLSKVNSQFASTVGKSKLPSWPCNPPICLTGSGNAGVASTVGSNLHSIGYLSLEFALDSGLDITKIKNSAQRWITPSVSTIKAAAARYVANNPLPAGDASWEAVSMTNGPGLSSYPVSSFSYFMFFEEGSDNSQITSQTEARELKRFMHWVNTSGQTFAADLNFVPLPAAVKTNNADTLKTMTWNDVLLPPPPS